MTTDTLRQKYLDFFAAKGHKVIASSSLVPANDPTLLFTCAGMNQFKNEFLGSVSGFLRAVTCQRCLRTDDLDKVGQTASHHTFFEMLGNFSFGSYFKEEAIAWAWEFLTRELKLNPEMLWVSVYQDDEEAFNIWKTKIGIPEEKIVRLGAKDNFWPANAIEDGPNGPCGPCSEIFFDYGKDCGCKRKECRPGCPCGRFVEIWNLVFTQFNRKDNGILEPLPNKNIDTGMGLERMASVMQGVKSNFEIDIFKPIIQTILDYRPSTIDYRPPGHGLASDSQSHRPINSIADHIRAIVFAIYDGVIPSNEQRGYVVRKLIRKAEFHGLSMGIKGPFLHKLVPVVSEIFNPGYPELTAKSAYIAEIILNEEKAFTSTLSDAPRILESEFKLPAGRATHSGETAFKLHDTYGIPLEITKSWAKENGFEINEEAFNRCLEAQQARSKRSSKLSASVFSGEALDLKLSATEFLGYDKLSLEEARILKIIKDGTPVDSAVQGDHCQIILDQTPFYAESGGQAADQGRISKGENVFLVEDVQKNGKIYLHSGKVASGRFKELDTVSPQINITLRQAIARAHTATHILQSALRHILGEQIQQAGSLVEPDRLRFDFNYLQKISPEELRRVEDLVIKNILSAQEVQVREASLAQAKEAGALAFFGEKYEEQVRVVEIGEFSKELCGGIHLKNSANVGIFKIISEGSISKGVRRIEALTGEKAWELISRQEQELKKTALILKTAPEQINSLISDKLNRLEILEKEVNNLKMEIFKRDSEKIIQEARKSDNTVILSHQYPDIDSNTLRRVMDLYKSKLSSYAVCLSSNSLQNASLLIALSEDIVAKGLDASKIIKETSVLINGSGGGKANMASAGGTDTQKIDAALDKFKEIVSAGLNQ